MIEKRNDDFAHGWRLTNWAGVVKDPPIWLSAILHITALVFVGLLVYLVFYAIWRLLVGTGDYSGSAGADHARNLLIALGAIIAAPFVVWRTWIGHQQWVVSVHQTSLQSEALNTSLISKSIELLGAMTDVPEYFKDSNGSTAQRMNKAKNFEARIGALVILRNVGRSSEAYRRSVIDIFIEYLTAHTSELRYEIEKQMDVEENGENVFEPVYTAASPPDVSMCFRALVDLASFYGDNEEILLPDGALSGINMDGAQIRNINFNRTYLINMKFSTSTFQNSTARIDKIFECYFYAANLSGLRLIPSEGFKLRYIDDNTIPPPGYVITFVEGPTEDFIIYPDDIYLEIEKAPR